MAERIELVCPECGKTLELPDGLEEFSCLYCGARLRKASVLAETNHAIEQYHTLREGLGDKLVDAVIRYPDFYKKVTKVEFYECFERYERENSDVLTQFDLCARVRPGMLEDSVRELCEDFMNGLAEHMQSDPRWEKKNKRMYIFFETKVVLAVFLTPLARKMKLETAEPFREEVHRQWKKRFPQENWTPGDFDVIANGFRLKSKFCFITTAVCESEGKPDDCAELTAFRAFRDGWLTEHGGMPLIERYYEIAPAIVTYLRYCDNEKARCAELRERWLSPCYQALLAGRYAECRDRYMDMVQTLEQRYLRS